MESAAVLNVGTLKGESGWLAGVWCVCWREGQCYNCCTGAGVSQLTINCRFHRTATLSSDTWRHVTRDTWDTATIVTCPALSDPCHTHKTIYPLSAWWMCGAQVMFNTPSAPAYNFTYIMALVVLFIMSCCSFIYINSTFFCATARWEVRRYSEWCIILPRMCCWH